MQHSKLKEQYDYTLYYRNWHDESESHAAKMCDFYKGFLGPHLPPPSRKSVLDIGCGMGFALRAMREYGFEHVQGVDVSPEQIDACQRLGEPGELVGDTCAFLSTCPRKFDVVLLLDVLEHVPTNKQIEMMRAVMDVLAPGGRVILTVP